MVGDISRWYDMMLTADSSSIIIIEEGGSEEVGASEEQIRSACWYQPASRAAYDTLTLVAVAK